MLVQVRRFLAKRPSLGRADAVAPGTRRAGGQEGRGGRAGTGGKGRLAGTALACALGALALLSLPLSASAAPAGKAITVTVTIHGHGQSVQTPGIVDYVPDRIPVGSVVTFKITNKDTVGHNFEINGHISRVMGANGGQAILRGVQFSKAGRYNGSVPDDNHSGIGGNIFVTSAHTAAAAPAAPVTMVRVRIGGQLNPETPGKITFAPDSVKAGTIVTFTVTNTDPKDDHVFEINGRLTKFIPSGGTAIMRRVTFAKAGRYTGSCPDNYRGIGGIFVVT